jgi:hypothetical protein
MDITGEELLSAASTFAGLEDGLRFLPAFHPGQIDPGARYRIVLGEEWHIWPYAQSTHTCPPSFRLTQHTFEEAVRNHLAVP